jgi:hypothetical protein
LGIASLGKLGPPIRSHQDLTCWAPAHQTSCCSLHRSALMASFTCNSQPLGFTGLHPFSLQGSPPLCKSHLANLMDFIFSTALVTLMDFIFSTALVNLHNNLAYKHTHWMSPTKENTFREGGNHACFTLVSQS